MLKVRYGIKMYIQIKHRNYKWYTVLKFETIIYTYFFHFFFYNFNHLIMCDKDEAFSPCDGHCLCVSHGIQCQCQSCGPKQGSQNHCFLLMWELFPVKSKTSKKIHKSNFNAFLLTSFIDYNISRKCTLNRFTYSV